MSKLNISAPYTDSIKNINILPQHKKMFSPTAVKKKEICCVRNCMSGKRKNGDTIGISFHVFPTIEQPQRRQKWLQLLNITNVLSKEALVCSRHFDKSDFFLINSVQKGQMYRVLRKTAVPTRCLPGQYEMSRPNQRNGSQYVTSKYEKIEEVKSFCRCCLKIDSDSRNMKDTRMILDGATINLFDAFFDCTSFKALKIDEQAQICDQCVDDLKRTIVFLSQCQASDALINNLFGNSPAAEETTDTDNDEGGDLLVPMRSGEPVILTKQEPQSSPPKPVIKTEVVDIDYEEIISTAQIKPTKRGYAIKRTASTVQLPNKRKSTQTPYADEVIGESVDQGDSEWTVKSMKKSNPPLKKRGRPRKYPKSEQFPTSETSSSPDNTKKPTDKESKESTADSETDTAESGGGDNDQPLKRQRGRPKGVATKRKYSKWVYLSPTAPLDVSEMMPLTNAQSDVSTAPATGTTASAAPPGTTVKKRWPYACNECNETFKLQVYLRYHQKSVHSKVMDSEKLKAMMTEIKSNKWGCKRCSQTFDSPAGFQQHTREHGANHKKPRFECSMCSIGFFRLERFETHIEKEHKITMEKYTPKYHCNRCRMNFHVANDFYNHPKFCKGLKKNEPTTSDKPTSIGTDKGPALSPKNFIEIPPSFFFCYNCTTGYLEKKYFDHHLAECYTNTELFCKCCICDLDVHLIDCNFKWPDRVNYKLHMMTDHQIKYNPQIHGPQPHNVRLSVDNDDDVEFLGF